MKRFNNFNVSFLFLIVGLFPSCIKEDSYGVPEAECIETSLVKTIEIHQIKATSVVTKYMDDDVIEAYVTSSDKGGNFFKSISFQSLDGLIGFSVPVDITATFTNFEPGRKVLIPLKDLFVDRYFDGIRIGSLYINPNDGSSSVGRLNSYDYGKVLNRSCFKIDENELVNTVSIEEAKNTNRLNCLLEIEGVQFSDCETGTTFYDENKDIGGATNHIVNDLEGNSLIVRISSYANFAKKTIPQGRGKIRGVMTKYQNIFQFIPRTERDIQMNQTREMSLINENFDGGLMCWNPYSVSGNQVWTTAEDNGNTYAKISGYAGSNNANEDWLISKKQDLSNYVSATLTFETAKNFSGNILQVYISKDYLGYGSPSAATWTQIPATFATASGYVWTSSGEIDLANYVGDNNIYIAFKYTSTTTAAATWELDNIRIQGN